MIVRSLVAAVIKDLRLLTRDKVGLVFLTIAPLIVMSVAGFSLSTLFGSAPQGDTRYVLARRRRRRRPCRIGAARWARRRLRRSSSARCRAAKRRWRWCDRAPAARRSSCPRVRARALARDHERLAASLHRPGQVRRGRERALRRPGVAPPARTGGRSTAHGGGSNECAQRAAAEQRRLERRIDRLRATLARADVKAHESIERARPTGRAGARRRLERELRAAVDTALAERTAAARSRVERELAPVREFLDALAAYRARFERWLADAREQAGRFADRIPPPPEPPALPAELAAIAHGDTAALIDPRNRPASAICRSEVARTIEATLAKPSFTTPPGRDCLPIVA